MVEKLKVQISRAWQWTLAHLPFGHKGAKNPVTGFMDGAEQKFQTFQQKRRMKQLRRRVQQSWSRLRKQVITAFARLRGWIERCQRAFSLVAIGIGLVLLGLLGLVLWRRSPAFRTILVMVLGAAAAAIATARAVRPLSEPTPIPNPAVEAAEAVLEMA